MPLEQARTFPLLGLDVSLVVLAPFFLCPNADIGIERGRRKSFSRGGPRERAHSL